MFKKFVSLIVSISSLRAFAIQPSLSVSCASASASASAPIRRFDFDLYATGHPQGGVTMFTGMFEADGEGLVCGHPSRGHLTTQAPRDRHLVFRGRLSCASEQELLLVVETDLFRRGENYGATLSSRSLGPLGDGPWTEQRIECGETN